jgi:hypothetical protein
MILSIRIQFKDKYVNPSIEDLLFKYLSSCESAQDEFYKSYWPCEWKDPRGRRCVNVRAGHSKGHQLSNGKVLAVGGFCSAFNNEQKDTFLNDIRQKFTHLREQFHKQESGGGDRVAHISDVALFHQENGLEPFVNRCIPNKESLESHQTCFGCLFGVPIHVLCCGHVLCGHCVANFAGTPPAHNLEITACPLCQRSWGGTPLRIHLTPPDSGLRILSLDG